MNHKLMLLNSLILWVVLAGCIAMSPASPAPASGAPQASAGPLIVQHAGGELQLEQPASRIVACSEEAIDFVLTLGVQPVGR